MSKTILVVSQRGITASSFLFKFAQEIELEHLDLDVDYASILTLEEKVAKKKYDIVLMSPNVRRWWNETKHVIEALPKDVKLITISDADWQYMDVPHIITTLS